MATSSYPWGGVDSEPKTLRERLEKRKSEHESQIEKIRNALAQLDANPVLEKFNDTIRGIESY